jgi:hypothetical protein
MMSDADNSGNSTNDYGALVAGVEGSIENATRRGQDEITPHHHVVRGRAYEVARRIEDDLRIAAPKFKELIDAYETVGIPFNVGGGAQIGLEGNESEDVTVAGNREETTIIYDPFNLSFLQALSVPITTLRRERSKDTDVTVHTISAEVLRGGTYIHRSGHSNWHRERPDTSLKAKVHIYSRPQVGRYAFDDLVVLEVSRNKRGHALGVSFDTRKGSYQLSESVNTGLAFHDSLRSDSYDSGIISFADPFVDAYMSEVEHGQSNPLFGDSFRLLAAIPQLVTQASEELERRVEQRAQAADRLQVALDGVRAVDWE